MTSARSFNSARLIVVVLLAAAVAFQATRSAIVYGFADGAPDRAAVIWPGHPDVLVSGALTEIGAAAAAGRQPPRSALASLTAAAAIEPLAPEPFLARGIEARQSGNAALATSAFVAAKMRAPREAAPRFLLAEQYLMAGDGARGLAELAALARLLPNGAISVAPALAAYAREAPDAQALKVAFQANPQLEQSVLAEMAKDPRNAGQIVRLSSSMRDPAGIPRDWVKLLINSLVATGDFKGAQKLWAQASGTSPTPGLFDHAFRGSHAPPPFNWTFTSDSRGFAEPDNRGGLRVAFYGRENAVLATQTLVLDPGRYRLSARTEGNSGGMLGWRLTCLPANATAQTIAATVATAVEFTVPSDCRAQRLDLFGSAPELPKEAEVTIRDLALARIADGR